MAGPLSRARIHVLHRRCAYKCQDLMLKNLKKRRALLVSQGELTEADAYNFVPVSFELPKVHRRRGDTLIHWTVGFNVPSLCREWCPWLTLS